MIRRDMARRQQGCLARCARWLGLDRNPLRRRTDRLEAAMRLIMVILLAVVVPMTGRLTMGG